MKRECSAGGIVFNKQGQVLLVQHSLNKYWGFPKGWVDKGEKSEETAVREVKEEGGVETRVVSKVGDSKYIYTRDGEKIFKVVTLYLMEYLAGDPKNHDWEMVDAGWFEPEEALKTLSFSNDKQFLKKALEVYNRRFQDSAEAYGK